MPWLSDQKRAEKERRNAFAKHLFDCRSAPNNEAKNRAIKGMVKSAKTFEEWSHVYIQGQPGSPEVERAEKEMLTLKEQAKEKSLPFYLLLFLSKRV